ncbi:GntR family transcriptional regulator [Paenibacillus sp. Soil522]|uniref:GntR family transcriptional regulator n=1 Tax=Paenibacillus sp. Soil522 TaxID=1736388 RepID=UPI000700CBA8|nr:GntR family transcriptional regulator [Paenibacillus sp. Soil522]KRE40935.1 GntR family transcriptional regulator [Paenibacillus sp. Soil522]
MYLHLDERSQTPIWEQIVQQTKERILQGVIQKGDKLMSVRELSATLLINPNTVSKAYQELERQGVIETRRGKGTFAVGATTTKGDSAKMEEIQKMLRLIVMESSYAGIDRETLLQWIEQYWRELGGGDHVKRTERR